jgi:hypothetical protein
MNNTLMQTTDFKIKTMNKIELHLRYKNDTSKTECPLTLWVKKQNDNIILDQAKIDPRIKDMISGYKRYFDEIQFPDPEYHEWLENTLIELLK